MSTTKKAMSNTETAAVQAVVQGILEDFEIFNTLKVSPKNQFLKKRI
jgi:hypothetical protein